MRIRDIHSKTIKALFAALCTTLVLQTTNTFASVRKGWEVDLNFDGIQSELLINNEEYYGQDIVYTGTPIKVEPRLTHLERFWKGRDVPDYVLINGVDYKTEVTGRSVKNTVKNDSYNKIIEKITVGERKVRVDCAPGNTLDGEYPYIINYGVFQQIDGIRYEANEIKEDSHNFCNKCIREKGYVLSSDLDEYYSTWSKARTHLFDHDSGYQSVPLLIYNKKTLTKTTIPTEYTYNNYTINGPGTYIIKVIAMGELSNERHYSSDARDYIGVKTFQITVKDGRSSGQQSSGQFQNQNSGSTQNPSTWEETYYKTANGAVGEGAGHEAAESAVLVSRSEEGPAGSVYSRLQLQQKKVKKTSISIKWKGIAGAKYYIYGSKCKTRMSKIGETNTTSFTQKKLKKGTYYKYMVLAVKGGKVVSASKVVHIATSGGKVGNHVKIALSKKKVKIKKGKTSKLKAAVKKGKLKVKKHRSVKWESANPAIATVSKSGKVKGIKKGKAVIYAYTQNGKCAKCTVTVK